MREEGVTFKKRRLGVLKKGMELSLLTNAIVMLKIFDEEDNSLIEYYSHNENDFKLAEQELED